MPHEATPREYRDRLAAQARSRSTNDGAIIENPLAHMTDAELVADVRVFAQNHLPMVPYDRILRAARVAKDIQQYEDLARRGRIERNHLPVRLTDKEKDALCREKDKTFSEKGMRIVIATVSLAALLQGFVQSSFNGASLYAEAWHLSPNQNVDWLLGAANASPWFVAALVGCPLSLPINYWFGRRGAIATAAFLILASSVGAIFTDTWQQVFCIRIVNGLGLYPFPPLVFKVITYRRRRRCRRSLPSGMGIKAVSTPILASETAVGFWRGSAILAWQLWVAFGIMAGFAFNIIFSNARHERIILALIQGAPLVPSLALLVLTLGFCPESPRYHLMKGPNYSVQKAFEALKQVRNTEVCVPVNPLQPTPSQTAPHAFRCRQLQALRDLYMVYKALEQERVGVLSWDPHLSTSPGFFWVIRDFLAQYWQLFRRRRLYNALLSACTVNLAQQLCGGESVFHSMFLSFTQRSGNLFTRGDKSAHYSKLKTMAYTLGFGENAVIVVPGGWSVLTSLSGAINFVFALPAVKSIDTMGRRKWLLGTLPLMALSMLGASLASRFDDGGELRRGVTAGFLYLFAIFYSPGLGPIPFTLAAESFPLSHREAVSKPRAAQEHLPKADCGQGTSVAISTNLFFAGLLSICYPAMDSALKQGGSLGLFSGLNIVALVLVFLLVEETKQLTLEELDHVFAVSKYEFMRFQVTEYLPWLLRRALGGGQRTPPVLYKEMTFTQQDSEDDIGPFPERHSLQSQRRARVVLRGLNVAGDSKLPSEPSQPSHEPRDFFDGDNVSFHQRPFTREDAPTHFARIRRYGFNTIRYVFTWEAIEAAGPGKYDEDFIQHTIDVLRIAKTYGFYVFMDPHQDVWSRFTGGSGAPLWTIYACGLDPRAFAATEAALVQNTWPDPDQFPRMIWATNYNRLAAATIFTLFFAGSHFAPRCVIDSVNIQHYLQTHFVNACAHLAKRIREAGHLEDLVVVGWESLNEPNRGMIGHLDLTVVPKDLHLKKGTCPSFWQAMLTGMGRACEIETWDMGGMGPYKTGTSLVDPRGQVAWLPADYDDSRYGWNRHPDWRLGECIWAQHGVWDLNTDTILKKDYFAKNPDTDVTIDYPEFTNTYFMDFFRRYRQACRAQHPDCIMLLQYPTLELPPLIKGTEDDDARMAFTPHFYDGITLMTKHWNSTWNVDVVGVLRGKYFHPAFAIKIGETAIRNSLREQLAMLRQEGIDRTGNRPCILSEFGIPYDMDEKEAYKTGDYTRQSAALDANYYGVEGSQIEGHCLWLYCVGNNHERGDNWNGEDLSICSVDDKLPPQSPMGPSATTGDGGGDDEAVTPNNLQRALTNPSISTGPPSMKDPELTNAPGYRAAEAFIRPTPTAVAGDVISSGFDLRRCVYELRVRAAKAPADEAPTVVFLPEFHFSTERCEVTVSSGKWEISSTDDGGARMQRLRWWHTEGDQRLTVRGLVRKLNTPQGSAEEMGYLEQCQQMYMNMGGNCSVM
ncbi:hypothetical protein L249_7568 [Ophiocordyceps polyrhachis-furcata BCC 54312]|uniref:Major facilitator superfamily (MFS) profile domain-containing protein n=1 Tax=Ophiocordyceps polyrhachis-furcata BCC 54312 TaxID=1330021 RepID=A0A367LAW5_9HYPO|nr:hypothetical protein L249_7568 [Ophiocordyceps polyrhachis-furcata BCC 54312]